MFTRTPDGLITITLTATQYQQLLLALGIANGTAVLGNRTVLATVLSELADVIMKQEPK